MSNDLKTQIRNLAARADMSQAPVTADEARDRVAGRDGTVPFVRPIGPEPKASRGPWPALVAAAVILVIFGVFAWVFPGDEAPPADTLPEPADRELGRYVPSDVPEGFVLQDLHISSFGGSFVLYIRDVGTTWFPSDGGFQVREPFGSVFALPEDPQQYVQEIAQSVPGSEEIEVGGRPAVILETVYADGPVTTDVTSVLVVDSQGGVFEISASGMTRGDVLAVASGVERVSVDEFTNLRSSLDWDLQAGTSHDSFQHEIPPAVLDLATEVDVALGVDLLISPRLAWPEDDTTVVTTEDGSVVEPEPDSTVSTWGTMYLQVPEGTALETRSALESHEIYADLSPRLRGQLIDDYIDALRAGDLLSEDPYMLQAPSGPSPQFDVSTLGQEIELRPVSSIDELPEEVFLGDEAFNDADPSATVEHPLIIIGRVSQPESESPDIVVGLWVTPAGDLCVGTAGEDGMGQSCGSDLPVDRFGVGGASYSDVGDGEVSYEVPLETSVVQITTEAGSFWQRPIGGHGLVPFGDTVGIPTRIVAYDAAGHELGEWEVDLGF